MHLSFENKVALVTGAASGIGLATARAFAEAGAAVALADVDQKAVRAAVAELVAASHTAVAICCNVANEAEVAAMVEQTVSTCGRLDAAFNNAGVHCPVAETADASGDEFDRVIAINADRRNDKRKRTRILPQIPAVLSTISSYPTDLMNFRNAVMHVSGSST
jgi:NAD(P)-dependent dehydrogenase (short-subunit alcohol dehydrogenase family)